MLFSVRGSIGWCTGQCWLALVLVLFSVSVRVSAKVPCRHLQHHARNFLGAMELGLERGVDVCSSRAEVNAGHGRLAVPHTDHMLGLGLGLRLGLGWG